MRKNFFIALSVFVGLLVFTILGIYIIKRLNRNKNSINTLNNNTINSLNNDDANRDNNSTNNRNNSTDNTDSININSTNTNNNTNSIDNNTNNRNNTNTNNSTNNNNTNNNRDAKNPVSRKGTLSGTKKNLRPSSVFFSKKQKPRQVEKRKICSKFEQHLAKKFEKK